MASRARRLKVGVMAVATATVVIGGCEPQQIDPERGTDPPPGIKATPREESQ